MCLRKLSPLRFGNEFIRPKLRSKQSAKDRNGALSSVAFSLNGSNTIILSVCSILEIIFPKKIRAGRLSMEIVTSRSVFALKTRDRYLCDDEFNA